MKRLLIYISAFLFTMLIFAVIGIVILCKYIEPNDFKPLIASQLKKAINRDVSIKGDLSWGFYPELAVKLGRITINPPAGKSNPKIEIANASVNVRLMPLFHRQVDISGITLSGINVTDYHIKNAAFHADNVKRGASFPAAFSFDYIVGKQSINVDVTTQAQFNETEQTLALRDLKIQFADIDLQGDAKLTQLSSAPVMSADLSVKAKHLKSLLKALGQEAGELQAADQLSGNIHVTASAVNVKANGMMMLESALISGMKFENPHFPIQFNDGVFSSNPITATFYQGKLNTDLTVNLNTTQPSISITSALTRVNTKDLWHDLNNGAGKISLETIGDIKFQVKTIGSDSTTLMRGLNGTGEINFGPGVITGIDLKAVIQNAYALIKKQDISHSGSSDQSAFERVTGTFNIQQGVIQSDNVILDSADFATTGNGRVDLPSKWINFLFNTRVKKTISGKTEDWTNLYGVAIPVAVRGHISDPTISLDAGLLLRAAAEKQIERTQDKAKTELKKKILEQVPAEAGDLINKLIQ